jgi:hypothetical protein
VDDSDTRFLVLVSVFLALFHADTQHRISLLGQREREREREKARERRVNSDLLTHMAIRRIVRSNICYSHSTFFFKTIPSLPHPPY